MDVEETMDILERLKRAVVAADGYPTPSSTAKIADR